MQAGNISEDLIWELLSDVPDPEIPVISVVELGVVRNVTITNNIVHITITPTYSGCPATETFIADIYQKLHENNILNSKVSVSNLEVWTTDWMTVIAKEKLQQFGIAPPQGKSKRIAILNGEEPVISCPQCASTNTTIISQFGSTACKAMYKCADCLEPFEYFKCI